MRKWMRERMKRRKKTPSKSETGKDAGQPQAPLQPAYPEDLDTVRSQMTAADEDDAVSDTGETGELSSDFGSQPRASVEPAREPRVEYQTQPENPNAPPQGDAIAASPRGPRQPKGVVVLTIGLPGSGKTTWFRRRGVTPLSSDMLRNILFDDIEEQRYQGLVFSTLRSLLRARLIAKMPWNYVDATNLSPHERRQWIKMAKSFGYDVQAVFFDVPLEVCLERNRKRDRQVAEDVLRRLATRLKPPTFQEGFSKIVAVRVKKSDGGSAQ